MIELPTDDEPVKVIQGDCLDVLRRMPDGCVDAVITDPPYELGFMGKGWDRSGVAFDPATWAAVLSTVKPGGYLLAFAGSRTQHRIACAIEDGGWEIRDCLLWLYGTGFPKGQGCLKPAYEPIILARRPGPKVLPLGVDECRVPTDGPRALRQKSDDKGNETHTIYAGARGSAWATGETTAGRYPANILHDGSDEVMEAFAAFGEKTSGKAAAGGHKRNAGTTGAIYGGGNGLFPAAGSAGTLFGDTGTAARFFYCAKASKADRGDGNTHPTVKPTELMRWLVRLVCPNGGTVLDPFAGSGTTAKACQNEGRRAILIEKEPAYCDIIRKRLSQKGTLFAEAV